MHSHDQVLFDVVCCRSDLGPEVGYEAIGLVDSRLPTVAVFAKGSEQDTPASAESRTGESLRSETEQNKVTSSVKAPVAVHHVCSMFETKLNCTEAFVHNDRKAYETPKS